MPGSHFFNTDNNFNIAEYFHFCNKLLIKEPKEKGKAPAMIVFCAFEQMHTVMEYGKKHGFINSYPIFFIKNYSAQVLKANMKIVGATEHAVVLYRDKLPKFNNGRTENDKGKMVYNWFEWKRDSKKEYPKIHPTQKPVSVLKRLIEISTDAALIISFLPRYLTSTNSMGLPPFNRQRFLLIMCVGFHVALLTHRNKVLYLLPIQLDILIQLIPRVFVSVEFMVDMGRLCIYPIGFAVLALALVFY